MYVNFEIENNFTREEVIVHLAKLLGVKDIEIYIHGKATCKKRLDNAKYLVDFHHRSGRFKLSCDLSSTFLSKDHIDESDETVIHLLSNLSKSLKTNIFTDFSEFHGLLFTKEGNKINVRFDIDEYDNILILPEDVN
jgi:hypothetical protein